MKWIIPENSLGLAPVRLVVIFHKCSKWDSRGATHVAKKINWQWSCDPLHEPALYPYGMSFFMVCAVFDKTFSWWQASVNCCCMFPNQFLPKMFCGYRVFSFSLRKIKAESFKGTILSKLVVTENPWKIDTGQTKDICLELPGGIVILSKTNQDLDGSIYVFTCPFIFECSCQSVHGSVLYPTCSAFDPWLSHLHKWCTFKYSNPQKVLDKVKQIKLPF